MELIEKLKEKPLSKKQIGAICACVLICVCGAGYGIYTMMDSDNAQSANANMNTSMNVSSSGSVYMEETVELGNIVVGTSETGTASMDQIEVAYDFAVEVEEFYVKAGEDVVEGQALALLNMDTVNELKGDLEIEIADAITALADAEADYDLQVIQAEKTLAQSIYYGENADYFYALELSELQEAYNDLLEKEEELEEDWWQANDAVIEAIDEDYDDDRLEALIEVRENYVDLLETARENVLSYENSYPVYLINAEADYKTNLANYASAYDVYDNAVSISQNAVDSAEQTLETLQSEYEAYDELPEDGIVLAPCSGYVMSLAEEDTEYTSGRTLVTIGSDQSVVIWVSISQDDIADISIGMETNVIFDAYEEYTIPAVVESISTSSSSGMTSSVNYTMEISCDISSYEGMVVFDSMSATVTFVSRQESDVILVSSKCITTTDGVSYVKVLDDNGDVTMVEVETGFSDGFDVEIVSGLEVGDVVIIESAVG